MAKKWSDVAASAAFQALSSDEQEEARQQYFDEVVAPRVPTEDIELARGQFLSSTTLRPAPAAETKKSEPGLIDRATSAIADIFKPAPKSVMENYVPTPEERQADVNRRLSYGAGPISSQTAAQADLVRSGMAETKSPVVKKVAKAMDEQGVTSVGDLTDRAKQQQLIAEGSRSAERQAFAEENPILGGMASGAAGALGGAINVPSVAADFVNQSVVNPVLRAMNLPELDRAPTMVGTEYLTKAASDFMPQLGRKSMTGAWNREEFLPWLGVKLAANSVSMGQSLAAAFVPPLRAVLLPGMGGTAAGQSFVEGDDSRVAVAKGAIEIGTEMLPLKAIDKIGDVLKAMGPSKSTAVLAVAGQRLLQSGGAITANALTNAIEESAAQLGGNVLDKYFQGKDIELTKGLGEAAVVGAAAGKIMSAPQVAGIVTGAYDPNAQIARAINENAANTRWSMSSDDVARNLLDPNAYDASLISPAETTKPVNFTPPDSPTAQAGLQPIVVPVPADTPVDTSTEQQFGLDALRMGGANGATGPLAGSTTTGTVAGSDQPAGSVGITQPSAAVAGAVDQSAGQPAAGAQQDVAAGSAAGQQPANVTPQTNNNAVVQPSEQWFGRKGDGYVTQADASQALPGRARMFPTLDWKIEQMPNGKFRLAGYNQETNLGTQTSQAVEGETQGQQTLVDARSTSPAMGQQVATGGAAQTQSGSVAGVNQLAAGPVVQSESVGTLTTPEGAQSAGLTAPLRLAPPAPLRAVGKAIVSIKTETGVDAEIDDAPMTLQQQAASAIARMSGRTVTILKAETPGSLPNGFMIKGDDKNIYIANDSDDAPLTVAMHEIYHTLPEAQRKSLNTQLLQLFRQDQRGEFATQFQYDAKNNELLDEEIPAFMAQAISRRADFWQDLRTKMGNAEFAEVAKVILAKLNAIVSGAKDQYGDEFVNKYITDVAKARDLLSTAYAEAMREQGLQPDTATTGEMVASRRAKTDKIGDYEVATAKDGSLTVYGDSEAIRAAMPDGVVGRVTKEGVVFTNAAAPRVRAALEGRNIAYSRGGAVLEKLPMKDGKYLGAPEKFNTPGKIPTLRKWLRQLADEGAPGRYWYENSGKEVLKMVGGDVQEARKFVALLAIYSPQAKVDANSTFALRAWAQYKAGQPISVKTGVMDSKAKNALDHVDEFWSGEKTGNFFFNLLREIDPSTEGKQGATIDMWMMRAGQYNNDAPTATQYAFMENETNRLAAELGWEPQQVQAAIWVAMKARMENSGVKKATEASSEKKGWIRFESKVDPETGKKKKVRVIIDEQKHRDNWLKHSFEHDVTKDDTQQAKFDFGDGLKRHIGQISFEARPGRSTAVLPGIHTAPYAQQIEFQQAVQAAFLEADGSDRLAQMLGLLIDTNDVLAPGVWQAEVSPSSQKLVAMAPAKGDKGKSNVDPAQAEALSLYAAAAGLVARQEGVGWHRPFYAGTKKASNGLDIDLGRVINPAEAADLEKAIAKWMTDNGKETYVNDKGETKQWNDAFAIISSPSGIRLVNFGIITNDILQSAIVKVAEGVLPDFDYRVFASDGDMPTNNWKENPNGESYVQRISAAGRSDILDWARAVLAPRVDRVFNDFSKKYGWGDPGKIQFSQRATGPAESAGRSSVGRDQGDAVKVAGAIHYGQEAGLSVLSGARFGAGIKGAEQTRLAAPSVDPRIKRRVYFYLPVKGGIPQAELGLGSNVYSADLSNLYDPSAGSRRFPATPNEFESAVLDAGFRGYINREQGTAVVLNSDVPVKSVGKSFDQTVVPRKIERVAPVNNTRTEGDELVRRPDSNEMADIVRVRPALVQAAPSFKLQFGEARVNAADVNAANQVLADAGSSFSFDDALIDSSIQYSKRTKPEPKKTVIAYKLFRAEADRPGELFPLFVPVWGDGGPQKYSARDPRRHGEGLPIGEWYDAEVGESAPATKTGKPQVKSKLGGLAFRPGWHAGDLPIATHIGAKSDSSLNAPDLRAPNQVWAEVEMPDDVDWQTEANKRGINKKGAFIAKEAHITDQIPEDGFYRYKTNSNMTGNWLIGGSMKITRILSDDEVKAINDAAGTADLPRAVPFDAEKYGFDVMSSNRAKPEYTHEVIDPRNGNKVMGRYQSAAAARRGRDRLDNIYGAYRYRVRELETQRPVFSNRADDIGAKLQARIDQDFEGAVAEYSALPGTDGGRILDTDIARELSPEYRADRTRAPEVHTAASDFIERMFYQRVQNRTSGTVAFMSGGGGAGKSSADNLVGDAMSKAHTVLDGTLSSPDKAARLIGLVTENGQNAVVTYIYRDPVEAVSNPKGGVLNRAMRTGRVVPIYSLVKTHSGASETVRMLQEAYGDDPRFKLYVVDNSRGQGNAALSDLQSITPVIKSGLKERLYEATQQAYDDGRISRAVYDATIATGQQDTGAEAQGQARDAGARQEDEGALQGRAGPERSGNTVELEALFQDLQDSRGLKLVRANERVAEHPMAAAIEYFNANFYDILGQLDDAGAIKINCK